MNGWNVHGIEDKGRKEVQRGFGDKRAEVQRGGCGSRAVGGRDRIGSGFLRCSWSSCDDTGCGIEGITGWQGGRNAAMGDDSCG